MTKLPPMTQQQAYLYLDFVMARLQGWEVVDRTKHHHRSNAAKRISERFCDIVAAMPKPDAFFEAAMAGEPVHLLWPEELRDEAEREINTKVPRAINEPTSPEFIKSMHDHGRTDWVLPDFLANHGRDA